jgi:manganese/zinc/iron transport system permease protein
MSDAVTHSVLLGIVLAFFITRDLASPLLIVGAAAAGLFAVVLIQFLSTRRLAPDAAIGLVFPLLFSVAVILISRYAGSVHLDTDVVLLGELAFVPFDRLAVGDYDLGPVALYKMAAILVLNLALLILFFKELKLATFDPTLAGALGLSPALIHYGLMGSVSVTAVGAFDAVGSILVVALMITPPATAYLLTDDLRKMVWISAVIAAGASVAGFWLAHALDASIAGSMSVAIGIAFLLAFLFSPQRGVVAAGRRRIAQRWRFASMMLAIHLVNHEGSAAEALENRADHLEEGLHWEAGHARRVLDLSFREGLVTQVGDVLKVTDKGRALAREAFAR